MSPHAVFIYGTLKHGGRYHHLIADQNFVAEARTAPGFTLYQPSDYPAMVREESGREGVSGEIWEVSSACLEQLDQLEGIAEKLYERVSIPLAPPHAGRAVEAYLYLRSLKNCPHLGSTWENPDAAS